MIVMSDLENVFARVRHEAARRALPSAAQLRSRGDRRVRRRAVLGTLAVAAVIAAGAAVLLPALGRLAPDQVTFPSGSAVGSPSAQTSPPSPSAPASPSAAGCPGGRYAETIPAAALVSGTHPSAPDQPLDYRCGRPPGDNAERALPEVCPDRKDDGDASILARRGIHAYLKPVKEGYTPNTYFHTVTKYTATEAASAYLAGLRAAVDGCGGHRSGDIRYDYAVVSGPALGDESLALTVTVTLDRPVEGTPTQATFRISVVRVGSYVSVVHDSGWEGSPSSDAELGPVLAQAAAKLSAL